MLVPWPRAFRKGGRSESVIQRLEHQNRYVLTPDGIKVALFFTTLHNRVLRPLLAADLPPAPLDLRRALRVVERSVDDYLASARIAA